MSAICTPHLDSTPSIESAPHQYQRTRPQPTFLMDDWDILFHRERSKLMELITPTPRVLLVDRNGQRWLYAPNGHRLLCCRRVSIEPEEWIRREVRRSGVAVVFDDHLRLHGDIYHDFSTGVNDHSHVPTGDFGFHRRPLPHPLPGSATRYWRRKPERTQWRQLAKSVCSKMSRGR